MKKYDLIDTNDIIRESIVSDKINRVDELLRLIRVCNSINTNYIISLDGRWGCGKSFLMKQLMYVYSNDILDDKANVDVFKKKYIPIYYNAWENDDHENVLESLTYAFLNEYKEYEDQIEHIDFKDYKEKILKNIINTITGGIISKDMFDEINDFKSLADSIYTIEEKKNAINTLYTDLMGDKRLLLIVDELDRCKPDYAVKVLETIKHFYKNNNMTILVVTDNVRLSETVKHFYGYGIDGSEYLNRIYDTVISININNIEEYVDIYSRMPKVQWLSKNFSILLFKYFEYSYRECNRFFTMYDLCINYIEYNKTFSSEKYIFESQVLVPYAIALKIKSPRMYNDFINKKGESDLRNLLSYLIKEEKTDMYRWIAEIIKPESKERFKETFIKKYLDAFNNNGYFDYPFKEAISLFGNEIVVEE